MSIGKKASEVSARKRLVARRPPVDSAISRITPESQNILIEALSSDAFAERLEAHFHEAATRAVAALHDAGHSSHGVALGMSVEATSKGVIMPSRKS